MAEEVKRKPNDAASADEIEKAREMTMTEHESYSPATRKLHRALLSNNVARAREALAEGGSANEDINYFISAVRQGHLEVVELCLPHYHYNGIFDAAETGDVKMVALFLRDRTLPVNETTLSHATQLGFPSVVRQLLDHGVTLDDIMKSVRWVTDLVEKREIRQRPKHVQKAVRLLVEAAVLDKGTDQPDMLIYYARAIMQEIVKTPEKDRHGLLIHPNGKANKAARIMAEFDILPELFAPSTWKDGTEALKLHRMIRRGVSPKLRNAVDKIDLTEFYGGQSDNVWQTHVQQSRTLPTRER